MGDIGKDFKYAELGRYGYCIDVAFLWGGASLSLWDKMCFFLTAPLALLLLGSCRLVLSDFAKI